jgi:hypothetical protein
MGQIDPELVDKVRELGPSGFAELLIAVAGDETTEGSKLLVKKLDNTFENIKSNDAGALLVKGG